MALESAIGAEPLSEGLSTAFVRASAQDFQGRVAAGTGCRGGWRKTRERLQIGEERSSSLRPIVCFKCSVCGDSRCTEVTRQPKRRCFASRIA